MKDKRIVVLVSICAAIGLFIYLYLPGYSKYQQLREKETALLARIAELEETNDEIKKNLELLENDLSQVEKLMRNDLGLVKPGEMVYKVVEEPAAEPVQKMENTKSY